MTERFENLLLERVPMLEVAFTPVQIQFIRQSLVPEITEILGESLLSLASFQHPKRRSSRPGILNLLMVVSNDAGSALGRISSNLESCASLGIKPYLTVLQPFELQALAKHHPLLHYRIRHDNCLLVGPDLFSGLAPDKVAHVEGLCHRVWTWLHSLRQSACQGASDELTCQLALTMLATGLAEDLEQFLAVANLQTPLTEEGLLDWPRAWPMLAQHYWLDAKVLQAIDGLNTAQASPSWTALLDSALVECNRLYQRLYSAVESGGDHVPESSDR